MPKIYYTEMRRSLSPIKFLHSLGAQKNLVLPFLLIISFNTVSSFAVNKSNTVNVITKKEACRAEISGICGDRVNVDAISDLEAFDCLLNKEVTDTTKYE